MPVKWDAEADHILLLKLLETHGFSVNAKLISDAWPKDRPQPTPRAISERFVKIRSEAKKAIGADKLPAMSIQGDRGDQPVPVTPIRKTIPKPKKPATPRINTKKTPKDFKKEALPTPITPSIEYPVDGNDDENNTITSFVKQEPGSAFTDFPGDFDETPLHYSRKHGLDEEGDRYDPVAEAESPTKMARLDPSSLRRSASLGVAKAVKQNMMSTPSDPEAETDGYEDGEMFSEASSGNDRAKPEASDLADATEDEFNPEPSEEEEDSSAFEE